MSGDLSGVDYPIIGARVVLPETQERETLAAANMPRTYGGLTVANWGLLGAFLGLVGWGSWATAQIIELRKREIVSVSLTTLLRDFVAVEAEKTQSPEQATARTQLFLTGIEKAMAEIKTTGKVLLLTEAVAGNTVRDVTPEILQSVRDGMPARSPSLPSAVPTFPSSQEPSGSAGGATVATQVQPEGQQ